MGSILKKFGQGILYILVLPLFILALALFGVYGVFLFLVLMVKSIILFFQGKKLQGDLPEDIEARRRLNPERVDPNVNVMSEERDPIVIVEPSPIPREETTRIDTEPKRNLIEESRPEPEPEPEEALEIEEEEENEFLLDHDDDIEEEEEEIDEEYDEEIEEEEEEEIPFLEEDDSHIIETGEDEDEDDSNGVEFSDWRK